MFRITALFSRTAGGVAFDDEKLIVEIDFGRTGSQFVGDIESAHLVLEDLALFFT